MPSARVNGVTLAYETRGDGPPLLFIHGGYGGPSSTHWPGPRLEWLMPAEDFTTILYDRRCAGDSEYVDRPFTLDDLARDAVALLDHLQLDDALVVGSSAGGMIALQLALTCPDRVRGLALVNSGAAIMHPNPSRVATPHSPFVRDRLATVQERIATLDLAEREGARIAVALRWDEWRSPPPPTAADPYPDHRATLIKTLATLPDDEIVHLAEGALRNMRALLHVDLTARLPELRMPVLVVHGDHDTVVPFEYGRILADAIPQARFVAFPGVGHGMLTLPEVQQVVLDWGREPEPVD